MSASDRLNFDIMKARYDETLDISHDDLLASIDTSYIHPGLAYDVDNVHYQIYKQRLQEEQLARELEAACAIGVKDATQQLHDGPSTHNNTTGGRSRAAPRRVPARKVRKHTSALDSSSDESDSEGSTFSPIGSPCTSRGSTPEREDPYEDPLSPEAQRMFLLIATSGILHLEDQWGGSTHKEVDYNPFLQDAEWYANQEREDDEFFTIYGDNGYEERINLSAEERRRERRASQTARHERVAKRKAGAPYARPTNRQSARQRCSV
ncbi:hypothetical protein GGF50DRAFT_105391 [Schizophyllum commune]